VFRPRLQLGLSEVTPGSTLLAVVHSTARGSRKALQDAMYEAGASNLSTVHQDFDEYGFAYDLAAIDRPLDPGQVAALFERAAALTGVPGVIRSLRQVPVPA
jgi:D-3-phosphoglycerate dehydrogenase